MQTKSDLEEILYKAFQYAVQRKSFTKMSLLKQAENVCVYGLGRYFEEAFFQQNVRERFHVNSSCWEIQKVHWNILGK